MSDRIRKALAELVEAGHAYALGGDHVPLMIRFGKAVNEGRAALDEGAEPVRQAPEPPVAQAALTDEQIEALFEQACTTDDGRPVHQTFARAILAAGAPTKPK